MIEIEPLGTECVLPAFVVGYEVISYGDLPAGGPIVRVFQQAGGYSMSYPEVVGVVLRLATNRERGTRPMDELIRGLKGMAEDPDMTVLADFPVLKELVLTHGDEYTSHELTRLECFVRRFVHVPAMKSGIEAFIRFEACDPLSYFSGWNVLSCTLKPEHAAKQNLSLEAGTQQCFDLADDLEFDELLLGQITDVGRLLNRSEPPGIFLLWENSD